MRENFEALASKEYKESSPQKDIISLYAEKMKSLEGVHWTHGLPDDHPAMVGRENLKGFYPHDKENREKLSYIYDPDFIRAEEYFATAGIYTDDKEKYERKGWTFSEPDELSGKFVMLRPRASTLDVKHVSGIEILEFPDTEYDFIFKVGDLAAGMQIVDASAVEITIDRTGQLINSEGKEVYGETVSVTKNSEVAKHSFFSDVRIVLLQLKEFGFKKIIVNPSDERRKRVYKRIGLHAFGDSEDAGLEGDIDEILLSRRVN